MTPQEASALLAYARQHDHLVLNTDAAAETWATKLAHIPFRAGKVLIQDYYGSHPEPQNRIPMDPSVLRQRYSERRRQFEARQRALEPPKPKQSTPPPAHVAAKFAALKKRAGTKAKTGGN